MYYLYLPGGFPAIVHEEERWAYARHPLLGAFTDPPALAAAYEEARDAAIERIVEPGRPNLPRESVVSRCHRNRARGSMPFN